METILTLNEEEVNMLCEILKTCEAYYEAIGDEHNVEVGYCEHLRDKLWAQEDSGEIVQCNNEIWW